MQHDEWFQYEGEKNFSPLVQFLRFKPLPAVTMLLSNNEHISSKKKGENPPIDLICSK